MDQEDQELSTLIKSQATRYAAPPELSEGIKQTLSTFDTQTKVTKARPFFPWKNWQRWMPISIAFASGIGASLCLHAVLLEQHQQESFVQEVVSGHIRALQAEHLTDVASSNQHTVK